MGRIREADTEIGSSLPCSWRIPLAAYLLLVALAAAVLHMTGIEVTTAVARAWGICVGIVILGVPLCIPNHVGRWLVATFPLAALPSLVVGAIELGPDASFLFFLLGAGAFFAIMGSVVLCIRFLLFTRLCCLSIFIVAIGVSSGWAVWGALKDIIAAC